MITEEQIEEAYKNQIFQFVTVKVVIIEDGKILLGKRIGKKNDSGLFELPGGKLELGETIERSGVREVLEETGIVVELVGVNGKEYQPLTVIQYDATIIFVVFRGRVKDKQRMQTENKELLEIGFYSKEQVQKMLGQKLTRPVYGELFESFVKGELNG